MAHSRAGDISEAIRVLQEAVRDNPLEAELHFTYANQLYVDQEPAMAALGLSKSELLHETIRIGKRACLLAPNNVLYAEDLAMVLEYAMRQEEAVSPAEVAKAWHYCLKLREVLYKTTPDFPSSINRVSPILGIVRAEMAAGNYPEAQQQCMRALEIYPDSYQAKNYLRTMLDKNMDRGQEEVVSPSIPAVMLHTEECSDVRTGSGSDTAGNARYPRKPPRRLLSRISSTSLG